MTEPLTGVVVALTEAPFDDLIGVVEVLVQEGLATLSFPAAEPGLESWVNIYGSRARIGVHGVRTPQQAAEAVAVGASFVLSDVADADLLAACGDAAVYPMAMTPDEIRRVLDLPVAGAQVFPADVLGPSFAEAVASLGLAERCLPRHALGAYAIERWFKAGARAAVADANLLGDALDDGDLAALRDRCGSFASLSG
ncbi:MAG: hypothetical protein Q3997_00120 [Propionibacteriaceae bacterium]|nr:hypothetical protein [Propionibacteriaceae bacterium]